MSRAALAAIVTLIVIAIAWVGRGAEGRRAVVECDAALARGDTMEAIFAARTAAEARCPVGCSASEDGLGRLERIAEDAAARGDDASAFAAWRGARAALLATSTFATTSERRTHAEAEIARFGHRFDVAAVSAGASPTPAAAEDRLRATLIASEIPNGSAFALVGLGGIVFLVASGWFAMGRKGARDRTDLGLAAAGAALAMAGALLF